YGGKTTLAPKIAKLLPAHDHYVEPFAGSLAVLLAKPRSKIETVNDLDEDLMTFWRVLREQPEALERQARLTPYSRKEMNIAFQELSNRDEMRGLGESGSGSRKDGVTPCLATRDGETRKRLV